MASSVTWCSAINFDRMETKFSFDYSLTILQNDEGSEKERNLHTCARVRTHTHTHTHKHTHTHTPSFLPLHLPHHLLHALTHNQTDKHLSLTDRTVSLGRRWSRRDCLAPAAWPSSGGTAAACWTGRRGTGGDEAEGEPGCTETSGALSCSLQHYHRTFTSYRRFPHHSDGNYLNACRHWEASFLLVACLTSHQHASVSPGRICTDNFTCCNTEIEVADQPFYLTQSQYTDTGPTSPSADPLMPGAWQGSH